MEAILQPYQPQSLTSGLASSSSSFDHSSSTNKSSDSGEKKKCPMLHVFMCLLIQSISMFFISGSFPDSDDVSSQTSGHDEVAPDGDTPAGLGHPVIPAANSDEGLYYQSVLLALERWFSLFGWPSGPHPVSVPHTLRRCEITFSILTAFPNVFSRVNQQLFRLTFFPPCRVVTKVQINHSRGRTYRVSQNKDSR